MFWADSSTASSITPMEGYSTLPSECWTNMTVVLLSILYRGERPWGNFPMDALGDGGRISGGLALSDRRYEEWSSSFSLRDSKGAKIDLFLLLTNELSELCL